MVKEVPRSLQGATSAQSQARAGHDGWHCQSICMSGGIHYLANNQTDTCLLLTE